MVSFGVRDILQCSLLTSVCGMVNYQHNNSKKLWIDCISSVISNSALPPNFHDPIIDWFQLPLLQMPLLDALVLALALDSNKYMDKSPSANSSLASPHEANSSNLKRVLDENTSPTEKSQNDSNLDTVRLYQWICIARLVQILIEEVLARYQSPANHTHLMGNSDNARDNITEWLPGYFCVNMIGYILKKSGIELKSDNLYESICRNALCKWVFFLRVAIQTQSRSDVSHLFNKLLPKCSEIGHSESLCAIHPSDLTEQSVMDHISALGLVDLFTQHVDALPSLQSDTNKDISHVVSFSEYTNDQSLLYFTSCNWITDMNDNINKFLCNKEELGKALNTSIRCYPSMSIPTLVKFPDSYTNLHAQISSMCQFEYPAVCLMCGVVLDAGVSF
jgi:hypothetical protein